MRKRKKIEETKKDRGNNSKNMNKYTEEEQEKQKIKKKNKKSIKRGGISPINSSVSSIMSYCCQRFISD